jgi:hypothetical protein
MILERNLRKRNCAGLQQWPPMAVRNHCHPDGDHEEWNNCPYYMSIGYELCMQHLVMYWDVQVNHTRETLPVFNYNPNNNQAPNLDIKILGLFARWKNLNIYNDRNINTDMSRARVYGVGSTQPIFTRGQVICPINGDNLSGQELQAKYFTPPDGSIIPYFSQDHPFVFALDDRLPRPYMDGSTSRGVAFCAQKTADPLRANAYPYYMTFERPQTARNLYNPNTQYLEKWCLLAIRDIYPDEEILVLTRSPTYDPTLS